MIAPFRWVGDALFFLKAGEPKLEGDARSRQHLAMVTHATLDHFERDEALDIGAELGEIFSRCAGAVLLQRTIDDALRQGWIKGPARSVSHENARVATRAVVAAEYVPQHAAARVG